MCSRKSRRGRDGDENKQRNKTTAVCVVPTKERRDSDDDEETGKTVVP